MHHIITVAAQHPADTLLWALWGGLVLSALLLSVFGGRNIQ